MRPCRLEGDSDQINYVNVKSKQTNNGKINTNFRENVMRVWKEINAAVLLLLLLLLLLFNLSSYRDRMMERFVLIFPSGVAGKTIEVLSW